MKRFAILVGTCVFFATFAAVADPSRAVSALPAAASTSAPVVAAIPAPSSPATESGRIEIAVLRARIEQAEHYQDQMINTVWAALALTGAVAFLVAGAGLFSAYREKRSLAKELSDLKREVESALAVQQGLLLESVIQRSQETAGAVRTELSATFAAFEEKMLKRQGDRFDETRRSLEGDWKKIKRDLYEVQYTMQESEHAEALDDKAYPSALRCSTRMLEFALQVGWDWQIDDALEAMASDIYAIEQTQNNEPLAMRITANHITEAVEFLNKLTGTQALVGTQVKNALVRLKIGT